jgi:putative hemolysin
MPVDTVQIDLPSSPRSRAAHVARPLLSRLAGLSRLLTLYHDTRQGPADTFGDRVLDALGIAITFDRSALDAIPRSEPLIVVANHPHGALDGLVLAALLRRVRPDIRVLANYLLSIVPELRATCFFVDPFGGRSAAARSLAGLRESHRWLQNGGALIAFPAGEVAGTRRDDGVPIERRWSETVARLAASTGATVLPAFINGANSSLFYRAGRLHPLLRTALLPRELLNKRGRRVHISLAGPLAPVGGAREFTARAREAVVGLTATSRGIEAGSPNLCGPSPESRAPSLDIEALSRESLLVDAGRYRVYCARASEIPLTLAEIGRLRSIAYRAAGEGTGADVDLDAFDRDYLHLFAWDRSEQRVVGGYRLGVVTDIVRRRGVAGLYTRSLFDYGSELIEALGPALELGRSFVSPEYQRNYQALLLLWRGIGAFVVRHPEIRMLFGPVSISGTYCDASHGLLAAFLEQNHLDASLARLISPKHPRPSNGRLSSVVPSGADEADRLIRELESDGKAMPVLLRQYLKLNARALGFSVDPGFGNVLDALMVVDLTTVPSNILRRYFGDAGLASYLAHHSRVAGRAA